MSKLTEEQLKDLAHKLRIYSIEATNASKSGHPTSCSSIAELISVLFYNEMRYTLSKPLHECSDRFVLSKGHAAPILYAAWAEAGLFPVSDLLNLRKVDSDLEGHPTPRLSFIDVGTGSLGQGLSIACGMAYVGKHIDKASYRVYVIVGDGESAEGSIWEALNFASHYQLDNLVVILDINRLGQSEETCLGHRMKIYQQRLEAFGLNALVIDGHDISEILKAFETAKETKGCPTAIIAKTFKGKYFPGIENKENWHGKPLGDKAPEVIAHLKSMMKSNVFKLTPGVMPTDAEPVDISVKLNTPPSYNKSNDKVATRFAYGTALSKLAIKNSRVIALDADTKNSTYSEKIKEVNKSQFIECYIAEQNLAGIAMGATCRNRTVAFVSTFATFFTRAFDQIRMGAISRTNTNFVGSHCGVSIGEDGPSQMGLEDLALFRSIPGSTVFYPSDAVSCERAVELAANTKGICYIRTSRPATAILYDNDHKFQVGKAEVIHSSSTDVALIISAGITLHESITAAQLLLKQGLPVRIMDLFTVKPLDVNGIIENAKICHNLIVVVEDHYEQGGIGEAVAAAVGHLGTIQILRLAVREVPRSGPPAVLLEKYGISAKHISEAVKALVNKHTYVYP